MPSTPMGPCAYTILTPNRANLPVDDTSYFQELVDWGMAIYRGWASVIGKSVDVAVKALARRWVMAINDHKIANALAAAIQMSNTAIGRAFGDTGSGVVLIEFFIIDPDTSEVKTTYLMGMVEGRRAHGKLMIDILEPGSLVTMRSIIANDYTVTRVGNRYRLSYPSSLMQSRSAISQMVR